MELAPTHVARLVGIEPHFDLDCLIAALGKKAGAQILHNGKARIAYKSLCAQNRPCFDAAHRELANALPPMVERDHLPVTAHIKEMIRLDHALLALAGACGEV